MADRIEPIALEGDGLQDRVSAPIPIPPSDFPGTEGVPMTASLIAPFAQVCAFALGCALIHAAREHAAALTRLLTCTVAALGALAVIAAAVVWAPNDRERLNAIPVYAGHPQGAE